MQNMSNKKDLDHIFFSCHIVHMDKFCSSTPLLLFFFWIGTLKAPATSQGALRRHNFNNSSQFFDHEF
jgi:hypothetical protein